MTMKSIIALGTAAILGALALANPTATLPAATPPGDIFKITDFQAYVESVGFRNRTTHNGRVRFNLFPVPENRTVCGFYHEKMTKAILPEVKEANCSTMPYGFSFKRFHKNHTTFADEPNAAPNVGAILEIWAKEKPLETWTVKFEAKNFKPEENKLHDVWKGPKNLTLTKEVRAWEKRGEIRD